MPRASRILVVEDDPLLADMIVTLLGTFEYQSLGKCDSGAAAIRAVDRLRPDLVLLDINLHDEVDGLTVAETILREFGVRSVLITGIPISMVLPKARRASPVGFLSKPFTRMALQTTVEMAFLLRDVQAELSHHRRTLGAMLQAAPEGLLVTDRAGVILEANDAVCRLTGKPHEELLGLSISEVATGMIEPEDLPALAEHLAGATPEFRFGVKTASGRFLETTFTCGVKDLESDRFVCSVHDLTDAEVRKQAESDLRRSDQRLGLALEAGGLGAFEHSLADDRIWPSAKFCRIVGLPLQVSLSHQEWVARMHPDDRVAVLEDVRKMLEEGHPLEREYRLSLPDGKVRWIRAMASAVRDASGRAERVHGVVQDVSKRKEAEAGLRRLSRAAEQSSASIVITDLNGTIEYVNPAFSTVTGYSADEVRGENPRVLKSGDMPADAYRELWQTILAGGTWRGEFRNRAKNGTCYIESASISPVRDEAGAITGFVAVKEDITQRKNAEAALRDMEQRYRALFDRSLDCVYVHDFEGRLLDGNAAALTLLGYQRGELNGLSLDSIVIPEHLPRALRMMEELIARGAQTALLELTLTSKSGILVEVESNASLVYRDGQPHSIQWIARDVTQRKEAASRLMRSNAQLETALARQRELATEATIANQAKSTFLTSMSHELRSPLNVINGMSATMQREFAGSKPAESAGLILECGEHLLGIIGEILDFSAIQGGHAKLDVRDFDCREVVAAAVRQVEISARQKSLKLETRFAKDVPAGIESDARRLQQILINLLQNAVKFTTAGGVHLTISARKVGDDRWRWSFSVADSGIGITREELGRLFTPFSQATAETAKKYGGTGLGLAISRSFAQLLGGDVVVRSRPGRGSCFRCSIVARSVTVAKGPAVPTTPARTATTVPKERLGNRIPLRILAADDIRTNREVLRGMMAYFGYRPDFCVNGAEVLAAVSRQTYDLVLLDVQMPVMDGLTAAREINRLCPDASQRPKLIALTADALPGDRGKCLAAGMDDYLAKPLLPAHLEACILRWFAGKEGDPAARPVPAAVPSIDELPLLDRAHLIAAFPGLSGPRLVEVLAQMQAAVLGDYESAMTALVHACGERNEAAAATVLHGLKGCFLTLGWTRIAARCTEVLLAVRGGRFSQWSSLPDELRNLCRDSDAAMTGHLEHLARVEAGELSSQPVLS